jgi:hypothetical protein
MTEATELHEGKKLVFSVRFPFQYLKGGEEGLARLFERGLNTYPKSVLKRKRSYPVRGKQDMSDRVAAPKM